MEKIAVYLAICFVLRICYMTYNNMLLSESDHLRIHKASRTKALVWGAVLAFVSDIVYYSGGVGAIFTMFFEAIVVFIYTGPNHMIAVSVKALLTMGLWCLCRKKVSNHAQGNDDPNNPQERNPGILTHDVPRNINANAYERPARSPMITRHIQSMDHDTQRRKKPHFSLSQNTELIDLSEYSPPNESSVENQRD